ncbi:hypothetical protein B0H63DRAFT_523617 [Podospora didyma]|uniref:Uncharacterized protein n=1 Tax=Podospora didyma TaxID=330526 RepID=A0AAE0NG36_9PEZI|nr:hypothetical protein B0H63DRAFT_523617 [Podospora didyma]
MGNCSSCLGNRRADEFDEDDEAQRLFDDSANLQYGSFDQQQMMGQEDPLEVQREIEALQRVVNRTSEYIRPPLLFLFCPPLPGAHAHAHVCTTRGHGLGTNMVDIYDIVPQENKVVQPAPAPYAYAGQDARMARYQTLLSKLSSHGDLTTAVARVDWGIPEDDTIEMQQSPLPIKLEGGEALVGNFADAADAMR